MRHKRFSIRHIFSCRSIALAMLFAAGFMRVHASDWVRNESKYNASMQGDHLCLEVFLADLDSKNTYSNGGHVYATNGSKTIDLMYLKYINQGDDESQTAEVKAYIVEPHAKAWFTNSQTGDQEIGTSERSFWLTKWGGDHHYMTAKIDYFFPAELAGETWRIYYNFKHSNDDWYTMNLRSSIYVESSLGLSSISTGSYTCERTSHDNIRFTVPKLPDDIPEKVSSVRERVCTYDVSYTFTCQDGSTVIKREAIECEKSMQKTVNITVPEEVGNPRQIDLRITASQGVKDSGGNYFWRTSTGYSKKNIFKVVPVPGAVTTEYRQFDKVADLAWSSPTGGNNLECVPYIYRVETDNKGQMKSGDSWSKRGSLDNAVGSSALSFSDNNVQQGTYYKYRVVNVPKEWIDNGISRGLLNNPTVELLNRLGFVESSAMCTDPTMSIYDLKQDTTITDKVKLTWQYSRVPTDAGSVNFKVMRKTNSDGEWSEYGSVNGDAQPSAGSTLSFVDASLPNVTARYQYKVQLSLLSDRYKFESDIVTAGLLEGSSVRSFEATKGTHDNTVRLTWNTRQVGSGNSTYVISRRYVNSGADFMRINSTSGDTEQFTYEDNTVQPGYYYEYKIEAYSGNVLQNTLYDVGFCQARGVISGRITFGTGSAVEDVRMSLQPSDSGEDNTVHGGSQYVDGASMGIAWKSDSTEIAKVFGSDKDYTVQMFVRPDAGMQEGAIIAEIPNEGRLRVGSREGDGYKLIFEKIESGNINVVKSNEYWRAEAVIIDTKARDEGRPAYYCEKYDSYVYTSEEEVAAKRQEIAAKLGVSQYSYRGFWIDDIYGGTIKDYYISLFYNVESLDEPMIIKTTSWSGKLFDTGLIIPANVFSLVTLQSGDNLPTLIVNDNKAVLDMGSYLSTQNYSKVEKSQNSDYLVFENGSLYKIDGVSNDALMLVYNMDRDKYRYFTAASTTSNYTDDNFQHSFSVGGAENVTAEQGFKGNFTEVRVWNHLLTDKEQTDYADRVLNGREQGLALYWPMDEGLYRYVFDSSYTNDLPNGRHATVGGNITASSIVPTDDQLSRYAITNKNGEYIIRGIPFVGSGSTYTVLPTKGIHEFNPVSRNGFIGNGSLTLNSYDFTDVSSFPVRGKITYLDTDIPVDSVQFMIDGNLVQSKEGVRSDANGEYEISVPIGEHLLECYMNGHRFTSFPLDGTKYDFKKSEVVNFVDSTLVNVTGRINGGFSDQAEPLGFNRSVNRIGQATIKLSLGKESQCSFNYVVDDHGDGNYGTADISVESATDSIKSTAYRAALKDDNTDTYYVYIKTDKNTGEFSAMLPPLKYKVESITFEGDKDGIYTNEPVFAQNLPVIDATNAIKEKMNADSIAVGDKYHKYVYSAKMIRQYRAAPEITVRQKDTKNGAFGDLKVAVRTLQNEIDSLQVLSYTDTGYKYEYGYPIFVQNKTYDFDINIAENYKNLDTQKSFKEIPRDAIVSITNDASVLSSVTTQKEIIDGKEVEAGMEVESFHIQVQPDSAGHVAYSFMGGWPNLAEGHLRNMNVSVTVDGRTTMWEAPNSRTEALDLILLGCLPSGTNFMTEGPDKVDYILRRPPGSTSVASFEKTEIIAHNKSTVNVDEYADGPGLYISASPSFKISTGAGILGPILMTDSKWEFVAKETLTKMFGSRDEEYYTDNISYSLTEKTSTPNFLPFSIKHKAYHPENGDTYVGHATNLTFSKARTLGFYQKSDGSYELTEKDGIAMSESFKTSFIYTQEYIEDYLIPNWKAFINDRLIHVEGDHWDPNNPQVKKVPGEVRYYTSYQPGDKEYGLSNGDPIFDKVKKERHGWSSYRMVNGLSEGADEDEVNNAINQIIAWESTIASNEADKLKAFEDNKMLIGNFSISGGTSYSQIVKNDTVKTVDKGLRHTTYVNFNSESKFGPLINDAGVNVIINTHSYDSEMTDTVTLRTRSKAVAWTMSDADTRTTLSVDVYKSPQGWGPIFRTRAGQTANPYEEETRTLYYKKGDESEKLNEGTMRVEFPQLKVIGSTEVTDVPMGSEAKFTLQLFNGSETKDYCIYVLEAIDKSNPAGAILMMDGMPLSNGRLGRTFKMAGGETLEKTLLVSQGDHSVTDYDGIELMLRSEQDVSMESDHVRLKVHFVPASAHVDLSVNHTVVNKSDRDKEGGIIATMYNLDRQNERLDGLRLRYRRKGVDTWSLLKQWTVKDSLLAYGYEPMPDGSTFNEPVSFLDDGTYELQAQTFGMFGNEEVTYQSDIIEVVQDTHGPKILGMVSPENGQLTYVNRNNMHLRFNEILNAGALSKSGNFRVEGGLNNVVYGESQYPDVAVQLNNDRIETDALYDLSNSDYAFDMWFYRQGDGTIISLGTGDNLLSLSTYDNGKLQARVGTDADVYDANVKLPKDKWMYLALNYKRKTADDPQNRITMLYATADDIRPNYIGQNVPAKDLDGHGKLAIGGDGMQGMIAELSIWNNNVTANQLYETRSIAKASYTPGLVGYWQMDEGHGTQITDRARSRNMHMESESWYINNENRAAHLTGEAGSPLRIDIATFNPTKNDNFAYEMWFRGTEGDNVNTATLMSVQNWSKSKTERIDSVPDMYNPGEYITVWHTTNQEQRTTIGFDERKLKLKIIETTELVDNYKYVEIKNDVTLSDNNYLDGNWHHLAFNVRRGTSAIAYIDGQAVKVLPEASVPGISAHYLIVGGDEEWNEEINRFTGDVDEIRIWSAALDGQLISDRMYERMDNSYPGLVGYFPMEEIHRTKQGTVTTDYSIANFGEKDSRLNIVTPTVNENLQSPTQSVNAPALKPSSTNMRLDDSQFDFTASADEIYFTFYDSSLPLMDNNDFVATVNYIKDEHGNNSETVQWKFHADFASVKWADDVWSDYEWEKPWNESFEWYQPIYNNTGSPQSYEISGLPAWLTVDKPVGTIDGDHTVVTFKVGTDVPVGRYREYIYLTDHLGIKRVMPLVLTVRGDEPDWEVNPYLYESNMMLTGQVYIDDKISEFTGTKVAAFDAMGLCRGVASPEYVSTRDAYYVNMIVYGASKTELSTGETDLTFKMYDASSGKTYPIVNVVLPGKEPSTTIRYAQDAIFGNYDNPVVFSSTQLLQQDIYLPTGWTWMSIYVNPESTAISNVLPKRRADLRQFQNIKYHNAFASVDQDNLTVKGSLKEIVPGNMYKVQVSSEVSYNLVGSLINVWETEATIYSGWNWIGTLANDVMSVKDAFAGLAPTPGDIVKSRTAFSTYRGNGVWEGKLKSIVPGVGYIYNSKAREDKTFRYPLQSGGGQSRSNIARHLLNGDDDISTAHYQPVDSHQYPDNMSLIAVVEMDDAKLESAEIGAFVNGECRGAASFDDGYYFLTVLGSAADDIDNEVELRVFSEGKEYVVAHLPFASDAVYGSLEIPYVLNVDVATGINEVSTYDDDDNWYTLQGYKLNRRPTYKGVYIHRGKKVTITNPGSK